MMASPAPMPMRVLIVEPSAEGHRLYYVRLLLQYAQDAGVDVTLLTTTAATSHANWGLHLAGSLASATVLTSDAVLLADMARRARELDVTRTVIPDGDRYLVDLARRGWVGSSDLSVLIMRPEVPSGPIVVRVIRTAVKRALIVLAQTRRHVNLVALRSPLAKRRAWVRWLPDPVTIDATDEAIRAVEQQTADFGVRRWVGVFGRITARKNLPLVLDALVAVTEPVGLVIAGSVDDDVEIAIEPAMRSLAERGVPILRLAPPVTDELLDSALSFVHCVIAAHSNEGPSGIVAKAAVSGARLVLAGAASLRSDARALPDRAEWVPLDANELAKAIDRALTRTKPGPSAASGPQVFVSTLIPGVFPVPAPGTSKSGGRQL